ncbi:MAG TPA: hypothetical protein VEZ14_09405 [Dehalococcoidia bacterium]|nr:hypothetical protein [Dehalococcoidia bacterium]
MAGETTERPPITDFYASVVDNAAALIEAHEIQGFDEELALLRVRFREVERKDGAQYQLMLKSVELIVRAVVARYRMSPRKAEQLGASIEDVLRRLGDELLPQPVTDV